MISCLEDKACSIHWYKGSVQDRDEAGGDYIEEIAALTSYHYFCTKSICNVNWGIKFQNEHDSRQSDAILILACGASH